MFAQCSTDNLGNKIPTDTPTSGSINVGADEAFQPFIDASQEVFSAIYKYSKIRVRYYSETEAMRELLKDSVRFVVISREPNETELKAFKNLSIKPRVIKIAIDGVTIITHPENPDSMLTMKQLGQIIKGKTMLWNQIENGKNKGSDKITLIFDKANSSNLSFMRAKFGLTKKDSVKFFASNSNKSVIEHVSQNKYSIGVIGANWVSDADDKQQNRFMKQIKVVAIAESDNPKSIEEYYQPYADYLQQKKYPLTREIFAVSREARTGLGTGFINFMYSTPGQRIILKQGLMPANPPIRLINLTN